MSKGAFVDFRKLKEQVGIRRILERYGLREGLAEQGDRLSGRCPFCEGESESFRVSQEKNCYKCFRCDEGGNILDFVATKEKCSVREAAVKIAEWFGIQTGKPGSGKPAKAKPVPKKDPSPSAGASTPAGETGPPMRDREQGRPIPGNRPLTFELKLDREHPWFAEIGLRPETAEEFGLGFCSKGVMGGRIAFPLHDPSGQLVGYAGRWPGNDLPEGQALWRYPKDLDLRSLVYPVHRITDGLTRAFLARDPLEVVMAWQEGHRNHVAFLSTEICGIGIGALLKVLPDFS